MMTTTLRDRLRHETATAHGRVDALFGSCDLATEQGYGAFLYAQAQAWETLRPVLDADSLARADALRRDLEALGLPIPAPLDAISLPAEASIGHRYVLEGSRLGSTVLWRELSAKAPDLAERAGDYLLESQKIDPWKSLSTSLQKDDRDPASADAAVGDAIFVFDLFERAWQTAGDTRAKAS